MTTAAKWTAIIPLFAITFLPLYVANGMFFPYITGKAFAFRILVEIAFAAYLMLALVDKRYRPRFSWVMVLFAGLVVWQAIANMLGVLPSKAFWSNFERMDGWVTLIHLLAFFFVASAVLSVEKLWRQWWMFFVSVAGVVSFLGLLELGKAVDAGQVWVRVATTLGNPIYLAVYLMFAIFAAAWLALTSRGFVRYACIAFMALATIVLFFTGSRGPLLGLVAGAGFASVFWIVLASIDRRTKRVSTNVWIALGVLIAVALSAGGLFLARESAFVKEHATLNRAATVFSLNQELKVRSTIWSIALEGVKEDPLTGWGQEGFNQIFNKYYRPSLYAQESWFDRAHNMYIDWLVAGGVPSLVLFLGLLLLGMIALLRATEYSRAEQVVLAGALVAYAVQALVVFDNLFSYVPLVMVLAMAHAASGRPSARLEQLPEVRSEVTVGYTTAGVAVLTLIVIWMVNVPNMRAAYHLVHALSAAPNLSQNLAIFKDAIDDGSFASQEISEQLVTFAGQIAGKESIPVDLRTQFAVLAVEEMGKQVAASPNDARLHVLNASAYDLIGESELSLNEYDAAIALSSKKQVLHLNRGFKLHDLGRTEEARDEFSYAYELDPSFDQVAISAATGYIITGDVAGGKALLMEAIATTTPDSDSLFYAYYQTKQWNELVGVARARVVATNGSVESRYRLVQALAAASRFEEARLELVQTMATFPATRAEGEALMKRIFVPA